METFLPFSIKLIHIKSSIAQAKKIHNNNKYNNSNNNNSLHSLACKNKI